MSQTTDTNLFREEDYEAIEAAVRETARGRWFLDEYHKRNQAANTQVLLDALRKLEDNIASRPILDMAANRTMPELSGMAKAITSARCDIAAVRNSLLNDKGAIPSDEDPFDHIASYASSIAADVSSIAETLQQSARGLRKAGVEGAHVDAVENRSSHLLSCGWKSDVLGQRVAKAMGLLVHLSERLDALVVENLPEETAVAEDPDSAEAPELSAALSAENLKYFESDEDLFEETSGKETPPEPGDAPKHARRFDAPKDRSPRDTLCGKEATSEAAAQKSKEVRVVTLRAGQEDTTEETADTAPETAKPEKSVTAKKTEADPGKAAEKTAPGAKSKAGPEAATEQKKPKPASKPDHKAAEAEREGKEKQRIVVIRHNSHDPGSIPLVDDFISDKQATPTG